MTHYDVKRLALVLAVTNEMVLDAAKQFALNELGEIPFRYNKYASKALADAFIQGALFLIKEVEDKGCLVNLVDDDIEFVND